MLRPDTYLKCLVFQMGEWRDFPWEGAKTLSEKAELLERAGRGETDEVARHLREAEKAEVTSSQYTFLCIEPGPYRALRLSLNLRSSFKV